MKQRRAIIIADEEKAAYHRISAVRESLVSILEPRFAVETTTDHDAFLASRLEPYDLCVSYVERWKTSMRIDRLEGLLGYLRSGGGLLALHNGLSYNGTEGFAELIGADYGGHPPSGILSFSTDDGETFLMEEEPYILSIRDADHAEIILSYKLDGVIHPAGWIARFGRGRVAYLMPGHDAKTFQNPNYRAIVARWARATARGWEKRSSGGGATANFQPRLSADESS